MDALQILDSAKVKASTAEELASGREFLLDGLITKTGLPFVALSNRDGLYYFEIRATLAGHGDYQITWDGHVSYSDYRDDGLFAYGASLFLYAGSTRLLPQGFSFRYLLFEQDKSGAIEWKDLGWQIDGNREWEDRELLDD